ncbi:MAG: hypothetical protein AAFV93_13105 [Chloroflexota bacterium]
MNESLAHIERIGWINPHYQRLEVKIIDESLQRLKPGESILVRFMDVDDSEIDNWDPYLREQWWPSGYTKEGLLLVERPFSHRYQAQQEISVIGPVGQPYRFRKSLRNVLLVAFDTPPLPLTIMIRQLVHNNISVTLVLLGQAREYETKHLPPETEVIHGTDSIEWADQVLTLGWADQMFVVVKQDDEHMRFAEFMQRVGELRTDIPKNYIFGVFQPLLPCGVGACGACMMRVDGEMLTSCTKGPTFDLTTIKLPT